MPDPRARAFITDLARSLRSLVRRPRLLGAGLMTLAPALAAAGAGLALVWTAYLRPLPYPAADRLAVVEHTWSGETTGLSTVLYRFYAENARSIERIGLFSRTSVNLSGDDQPRRVMAAQVTASTLDLLGARPFLGRLISPTEDEAGAAPVVVLTHALWADAFGADRDIVGSRVTIDDVRTTVVGVLPPGFELHETGAELLLPMALEPGVAYGILGFQWWHALARLAPGATPADARREMETLLGRVVTEVPDGIASPAVLERYGIAPVVTDLFTWQTRDARDFVFLLAASLLLLLVLAAAAMANLLLGRVEERGGEMRLRRALGASGRRVFGYLLADAVAVCVVSGAVGAVGAWALLRVLAGDPGLTLPRADLAWLPVVGAALAFGVAVSLVPLFGLIPLGQARVTRRASHGTRVTPWSGTRRALLGAQVAVTTVLVAAGLSLVASVRSLADEPLGFRPDGVLTFTVSLPPSATIERGQAVHQALAERLRALPGVRAAGYATGLPVPDAPFSLSGVRVEGVHGEGDLPAETWAAWVSDGYMETLGFERLAGRFLEPADHASDRAVANVNEVFARRYWGDPASAIGRRIRVAQSDEWFEVVGVVGSIASRGPGSELEPIVFAPRLQGSAWVHGWAVHALRSTGPPGALVGAARAALAEVAPGLPMYRVATLRDLVDRVNARERLALRGLGVAGVASLLVVAASLIGIIVLSLLRRRREIGVRKAVGATDRSVRWLLVRGTLAPALLGLAAGAAAVAAGLRVPTSLLHEETSVPAALVVTIVAILGLVALAGVTASWRTAAIQPSEALRAE